MMVSNSTDMVISRIYNQRFRSSWIFLTSTEERPSVKFQIVT